MAQGTQPGAVSAMQGLHKYFNTMRDCYQVKSYDGFILRASGVLSASMSIVKIDNLQMLFVNDSKTDPRCLTVIYCSVNYLFTNIITHSSVVIVFISHQFNK